MASFALAFASWQKPGVVPDLRDRRRALGLTQPAVALAAGLALGTVQRADWGLSVSPDSAERIEAALAAAERRERPAA